MALLTGKVSKEPKQQIPRERSVQLEQKEEIETEDKKASLLDTLNLSYAGNMDFSRALNQAKNIGSSVAAAMGSIVDLKLVHNVVSVALDKLTEADRRGRAGNEEKMKEQEELK